MRIHKNIIIEGRLLEKDFNYYCQSGAYKFDIDAIYTNGNERDIYIEAEGKPENLMRYIEYLENGPLRSSLITFKTEEDNLKNIRGFSSYRKHVNENEGIVNKLLNRVKKLW